MRHPTTPMLAAVRAVVALGCVGALGLLRPGWPRIASLMAPLTTGEVQELLLGLAWLLALVLALAMLTNATRSLRHRARSPAPQMLPGVLPSRSARPALATHPTPPGRYVLTIPPPPAGSPLARNAAPSHQDAPADLQAAQAPEDTRTISIAVLGPLAIDGLQHRIKRAATRELLTYLALHPSGASRDELVEALWPAQDPARTRPRFYQSVTEARKALGDAWVHQDERYWLDRAKVRIDLDDLDNLATSDADPNSLEQALALWRGEPLEGTDYLWSDTHIRTLRATLIDLLERVARHRLTHHDAKGALQIAEQAIGLDRLHEPSWRLALRAEHSLGQREGITERYGELARFLDEQVGLQPTRETRRIYRQLLGQD